ncbi:PTS sugar transporter subunit IIA [uncultured Enorma sp.]|uniref:PTS sugar transporter subunit IIA n=1 Tax=uncultured Enorma sp. TaxID=1714346 RepID=UPI00280622AC|nr:PTS sugar transporter subunit IIA [uncultured Enorma sp.]
MGRIDISLLKPELVFLDVKVADRAELFLLLEQQLAERGYIEQTWLDAVTERERLYPTGLACPTMHVAIPHTDPEHLTRPYIAIVRPLEPVVFEPMGGIGDAVQVELIINLGLLAHAEDQVAVLQAFMELLMDGDAVAQLRVSETPADMIEAITRCCA